MGEAPPRLSLSFSEDPYVFRQGDFIKIKSDLELVKELQTNHGKWVEGMKQVGHGWGQ